MNQTLNWLHIRVHENEHYNLEEITEWLLEQTAMGFVVKEEADEDVKRTHIHATISHRIKYESFKKDHFLVRFKKLKGKKDFGGHDIIDINKNDYYCCKGLKENLGSEELPFCLLKAKGNKYLDYKYFRECHAEYWRNNKIIKQTEEIKKKKVQYKNWTLDLAKRLREDYERWDNSIYCQKIVYREMMKEMSKEAKKLGARNFRDMHRGIMNFLCCRDVMNDVNWITAVFPDFDMYEWENAEVHLG